MKILRVQVPEFRVLKDVDLSFERDFIPSIFPLGSLNGGGKSTLLQLIFGLLHCSSDPERLPYLQNLLASFKLKNSEEMETIAKFEILHNDQVFDVDFLACSDFYINKSLEKKIDKPFQFSLFLEVEDQKQEIAQIDEEIELNQSLKSRNNNIKIEKNLHYSLQEAKRKYHDLKSFLNPVIDFFDDQQILYLCNYSEKLDKVDDDNVEDKAIFCRIKNFKKISDIKTFLKELSNQIFLAAPFTQIFHFIEQRKNKLFFKNTKGYAQYQATINEVKTNLPNFFTYDFIAISYIVKLFENVRDQDFQEAVKTGEYGNSYKKLLNELNSILFPKKINVTPDLNGVTFKMEIEGEKMELYPEDLSHGELKRISIYAWLKTQNIENSIVLMDEIENGFHPDWHYQIISDLEEWAPSNQYILATHSYELCQALTPSHVKELSPQLLK
jgi:Fe-S cluster assembly ATPase SufC